MTTTKDSLGQKRTDEVKAKQQKEEKDLDDKATSNRK